MEISFGGPFVVFFVFVFFLEICSELAPEFRVSAGVPRQRRSSESAPEFRVSAGTPSRRRRSEFSPKIQSTPIRVRVEDPIHAEDPSASKLRVHANHLSLRRRSESEPRQRRSFAVDGVDRNSNMCRGEGGFYVQYY